jgi:hypothetical protein
MKHFRIDWDASFWFAVAFLAAGFALPPVLLAAVVALDSGLGASMPYNVVNAGVQVLAFALTAGLLVIARPARRLLHVVAGLYALWVGAVGALAVLQLIQKPAQWAAAAASLAAPLTLGAVQVVGLAPLRLGAPDLWAILGVCSGFAGGRLYLRLRNRAAGAAADTPVTPMRLPSPTSRDTIDTHT